MSFFQVVMTILVYRIIETVAKSLLLKHFPEKSDCVCGCDCPCSKTGGVAE